EPAREIHSLSTGLTISLGPPSKPYSELFTTNSAKLADDLSLKMQKDTAKLNDKIQDYREDTQKDVGNNIEGTGVIKMGYFSYVLFIGGSIVGLILIIWVGLKIYGVMNPAVGLGTNIIGGVASSVVSKAFSEVVAGGEAFKTAIGNSPLTEDVK